MSGFWCAVLSCCLQQVFICKRRLAHLSLASMWNLQGCLIEHIIPVTFQKSLPRTIRQVAHLESFKLPATWLYILCICIQHRGCYWTVSVLASLLPLTSAFFFGWRNESNADMLASGFQKKFGKFYLCWLSLHSHFLLGDATVFNPML